MASHTVAWATKALGFPEIPGGHRGPNPSQFGDKVQQIPGSRPCNTGLQNTLVGFSFVWPIVKAGSGLFKDWSAFIHNMKTETEK